MDDDERKKKKEKKKKIDSSVYLSITNLCLRREARALRAAALVAAARDRPRGYESSIATCVCVRACVLRVISARALTARVRLLHSE